MGRYKRLNENANKWVAAYKEAATRRRSGMSQKDVEMEAHAIYEASGSKFQDFVVFNDVMCKHQKWRLIFDRDQTLDHDRGCSRPENEEGDEEESGASTKKSRTSDDVEYVFNDILEGRAPKINYIVNGRQNDMSYYLTDGIYPSWAAFVKSITTPQTRKHKLFAQHQEAVRKDVERASGVLQVRFAFIRRPCLVWDKDLMGKILMACIIMHNMIVEDECDTYLNYYDPSEFLIDIPSRGDAESFHYSTERITNLSDYMVNRSRLRDRESHHALQKDLIEHIWKKFGSRN